MSEELRQEIKKLKKQLNNIEVLSKQIDKVEHRQNQLKAGLERIIQEMDEFREENRQTLALILNRLSGN